MVADVTNAVRALAGVPNEFNVRIEYDSLELDRFPPDLAREVRALRRRSRAALARRKHGRLSIQHVA